MNCLCLQCGKQFEANTAYHHSTGLCGKECKQKRNRIRQNKYKKSEKGLASKKRWEKSDRHWLNEKRYRSTPEAKRRAVERAIRHLKNNPEARRRRKIRDTIYMSRTQGRLRGWWKEESVKGCRVCGSFERLTVDHIVPLSKDGDPLDKSNLQILCKACNSHKGNRPQNVLDVPRILRLQGQT